MAIKKLGFILIPNLSRKYLLFIGFLVGSFFRRSVQSILLDYVFKYEIKKPSVEIYFEIFCNVISDLSAGILHCILKKNNELLQQPTRKSKVRNNLEINFIFNDETRRTSLLLKLLLIISFVDFLCQLLSFCYCFLENEKNDNTFINSGERLYSFLVIDIVSRYIFSRLILNTYFYYHHYLSLGMNLLGLFLLLIIDIYYKIGYYDKYFLMLLILQYIGYSFEDIINKVALVRLFILPESLLFYKGIFSLAYLFIFSILLVQIDPNFFPKFQDLNSYTIARIITGLFFIVFNLIRSIYLVKIIDVFSSQHISFVRVIETILLFIFYKVDFYIKENLGMDHSSYFDLNIWFTILEVIAFLILFISALIHNEIIILDFEKFKNNTKYFLAVEAENEKLKENMSGSTTQFFISETDNTYLSNILNSSSMINKTIISRKEDQDFSLFSKE